MSLFLLSGCASLDGHNLRTYLYPIISAMCHCMYIDVVFDLMFTAFDMCIFGFVWCILHCVFLSCLTLAYRIPLMFYYTLHIPYLVLPNLF